MPVVFKDSLFSATWGRGIQNEQSNIIKFTLNTLIHPNEIKHFSSQRSLSKLHFVSIFPTALEVAENALYVISPRHFNAQLSFR